MISRRYGPHIGVLAHDQRHRRRHLGPPGPDTIGARPRCPSCTARCLCALNEAWDRLASEAQRENADGFRAYVEPVNDPAFDGAPWQVVKAAVPANAAAAVVLFIADAEACGSPDNPVLVVDLDPEGRSPFRCIASELWSVDNNRNLANMDWEEFAGAVDESGVFRGFD